MKAKSTRVVHDDDDGEDYDDDEEDAADHGSKSVAKEGRGEGAKSTTGSEPKSGSQDRGGLCKNLPIANWSPESRVPVVGILAFWFRTPTIYMSSTTKTLSKGGYNLIDHHLDDRN